MSAAPLPAQYLCASHELAERGDGLRFEVLLWGQPQAAFALRIDGRAVAYVNRCAHVPSQMDSPPGQFLTSDKRWIICSVHGAMYDPGSGYCIEGPCRGEQLMPIAVQEQQGAIHWWPTPDIEPVSSAFPE
ncbi:MAG: Rieske 2Fe-2S domain-containing protein [Proteobacteria bacterium]|nr:Rieske 2Fe-2S domain-containing protein [Pseudomonadota bacterium]